MLKAFSTAATGMIAQQMRVDNISNNISNMNTTGFKRSQIDFESLMYVKRQEPGGENAAGINKPTGIETGLGVRPGSTVKIFTQGDMKNTGRDLDVAIKGDGFLQVQTPNGETRYTRDGSLRLNSDGQLVTSNGFLVQPSISVPANARSINIGQDGTVTAFTGESESGTNVGQLTLARFANPSGLSAEGSNLLRQTPASGTAQTGVPGQNGLGTIEQGFLEASNVEMVSELVDLIEAQRAYETNSRAIQAGDQMLQTANRLLSR